MASVSSDPLLISMRSQGAREQNSLTTAVCNSDVIIPDVEKNKNTNLVAVLSFCTYIIKNAENLHTAYTFVPYEQSPFTEIPEAPIFYRFEVENKLDQTMLIEADIIKAKILQIGQGRSVSRPAIYQRIGQFPLLYPFNHILKSTFVKYFLSVYS